MRVTYAPGKVQVNIGITPESKEKIEKIAHKTSRSRAFVLERAIEEYLERAQSLLKDE